MESLGRMHLNLNKFAPKKKVILFLVCSLFALWNIPNSIAIRYTVAGLLCLGILANKPDFDQFFRRNWITFAILAYLMFNLVFHTNDIYLSFGFYRHIWINSLLFMILGYLVGGYFRAFSIKNTLLYFGVAFSIPIYLHLLVFIWKWIEVRSFPIGFSGITNTHGDMAYASIPALIFLYCFKAMLMERKAIFLTYFLIILLPLSLMFAASRGGLLFFIVTYLLLYIVDNFSNITTSIINKSIFFLLIFTLSVGAFFLGSKYQPQRWNDIISKAHIGFILGNPLGLICKVENPLSSLPNGVSNPFESEDSFKKNLVEGDLARVLVLRAGMEVLESNFWGIDGSKESYIKAIKRQCPNVGDIVNSAHNGWINMALAIGIPGACLYFFFFIYHFWKGVRINRSNEEVNILKLALIVMSVIWPLRALFDATMQDQMLQMQTFLLPFLLTTLLAKNKEELH